MKVYFFPPSSEQNISINMIVEGLEYNGVEVVNKKYNKKGALKKLLSSYIAYMKGTRVFHLNFVENYSANKNLKSQIASKLILLWLKSLKVMGCKLVWTMNNKVSHNCTGDKTFHLAFLKKFIGMMDTIVVYCEESKTILLSEYDYPEKQICSVAHGCFVPDKELTNEIRPRECLHILSFGLISKYKNILMLASAFKELQLKNCELLICGKCESEKMSRSLHDIVDGESNIIFKDGFLPESEVDGLFEWADIAIYPYETDSMLNSGAVIMGLSQGKPIIVSEFGYIKDIKNERFVISYAYRSEEDHKEQLKRILKECSKRHAKDNAEFIQLGREAYSFAHDNLDWHEICKKIAAYYVD